MKLFTDGEYKYDTIQRKFLKVVLDVLIFRSCLKRIIFSIRMDHASLKWILNLTQVTIRLARGRLRLPKFAVEVVHRAGIRHQAADALSRVPATANDKTPLEDDNTPVKNDLPLLAIVAMHNLADTHIFVIDTNEEDIMLLDGKHRILT